MDIISFYIDKQIVEVSLQRTNNKNMYLKVTKDNKLLVTAPKSISIKTIRTFVIENIKKFIKYIDKVNANRLYDLKESWTYVFGKKLQVKYMTGFETIDAKLSGKYLWLLTMNGSDKENLNSLNIFLQINLIDYIAKRQPQIEKLMKAPQHEQRVLSKTTSWASNSLRTKTIAYTKTLSHFSKKVIDYIIIHELAHYFVPNHSAEFWRVVEKYMPDYTEVRKKLKATNITEEE